MILSIKIPDEVYEVFGRHNSQNPRYAIEKTVERFAEIGHLSKSVILSGEVLAELQRVLGNSIDSPEGLLEHIKKAVSVSIDGVDVVLSESQRKNLNDIAKFSGQDRKLLAEAKIKQGLQATLGV